MRFDHAYQLARPAHFRVAFCNPIYRFWGISRAADYAPLHAFHGCRLCVWNHHKQIGTLSTASKNPVYSRSGLPRNCSFPHECFGLHAGCRRNHSNDTAGWTKVYTDPAELGLFWFWIQIPLVLLLQDWYFYWMHRISHAPGIYERVHKTHHLSTNPSAFAAFAFHPVEAFLEIAIFLVLVFILPLSAQALLIVGAVSLVFNVYGHLGYEIMPRALAKGPLGYLLNKSAFPNQHHRTYKYKYGLYTTIWDHADRLYDKAST